MRRTPLLALLTAVVGLATAGASVPTAQADVVWLCHPGATPDPCVLPADTTVKEFGRPDVVVDGPAAAPAPGIDCFYVYPTVSNQTTPNADKSHDPELDSIAQYQAARFSGQCRMFAPIYRQSTLASIATSYVQPSGNRRLAYDDVLEAWRAYLAQDNHGRGFVLIGHSQGTRLLRQLIRTQIDPDPALRRRFVGAVMPGANVTTATGRATGGDFRTIPVCTRVFQLGCVVAYSTFAQDPTADSRFGVSTAPPKEDPFQLPGGPGYEVACTDPRALIGTPGAPLRLLIPSKPYAPGPIAAGILLTSGGMAPSASTTWVTAPDRWNGGCRTINGAHVLRYDPSGAQSRRPVFFPEPRWGTHLVDVNLALDELVTLVAHQAQRYLHPRLRLTGACAAGRRLRLAVGGSDAELVTSVVFRAGARTLARDPAAPFARTVRASAAGRARTLRAVVALGAGARSRLTLTRPLPRC